MSSFYDRFTKELARMFRAVLSEVMSKLASSDVRYAGVLEGFRDVLVADATVVKLHRLLARRFPGTRRISSPAAAKLHLVMSVSGGGAHKVKVTGERANDHRTLQMGPWVEGRSLLFDLGYFRYQLFDCIDRNGGYFITRLATNADPRIVAAHRQWRGRAIDLEGKFKELKSHYRPDELPTRKPHIVETLLLGAVITLLVSRRLLQAVRERLRRTPYKMPEQRWAAIFAAAAPAILDIVLLPPRGVECHCPPPRIDVAPRGARPESVAPTPRRTRRIRRRLGVVLCKSTP